MKSLPFEVAVRYLKSRPSRLVSSVSLLSIAGIALGVAALVVAMGLLSGYRTEIREKLIGANAEIVVFPLIPGGDPDPGALERRVAAVPGVRATAPVIYQTGVASSSATPDGADAVLKGIDPASERRVSQIDAYLPDAERAVTRSGPGVLPGVALGVELARKLDVREGDAISLSVADASGGPGRFAPRSGRFQVSKIFRTNFSEYDTEWVFLDREELRRLARMDGKANVVEVRLASIEDTEAMARRGRPCGRERLLGVRLAVDERRPLRRARDPADDALSRHRPDRGGLDLQRRGDARHDRPGEEARHRRADDARRRARLLLAGLPVPRRPPRGHGRRSPASRSGCSCAGR